MSRTHICIILGGLGDLCGASLVSGGDMVGWWGGLSSQTKEYNFLAHHSSPVCAGLLAAPTCLTFTSLGTPCLPGTRLHEHPGSRQCRSAICTREECCVAGVDLQEAHFPLPVRPAKREAVAASAYGKREKTLPAVQISIT